MKDVGLYVRYTLMIAAFIVARRAPALSSLAGCQEFLFGAGGGRHPSEDMRGARLVTEARIRHLVAHLQHGSVEIKVLKISCTLVF